jgi:DNA-binding NtrC family response regulator
MDHRPGLVEAAQGGTLFLDEIGEMPLSSQAKLLRAIQNREVRRLGAVNTVTVNIRVVAATNRDLRSLVNEGRFREDLFHRLAMLELRIPRLADRREDLPLLQRHFLERFSAAYKKPGLCLTRRAQALLRRYYWPGNVRELENAIGHGGMMAEGNVIEEHDLPQSLHAQPCETTSGQRLLSLEEAQHAHVRFVLESVGQNRARAAEVLGVSRATLYRMLAESREADTEVPHAFAG